MQRDPEALLRASIKGLAIGDAIGRLVFMPEREAIDALRVSDEPYARAAKHDVHRALIDGVNKSTKRYVSFHANCSISSNSHSNHDWSRLIRSEEVGPPCVIRIFA